MNENKRYRKVLGLIQNTDGELFDLSEIEDLLNEQDKRIRELETELKLYRHYVEFVSSSGDVE